MHPSTIILWIIGIGIALPLDWLIVRKLSLRWYHRKQSQQQTNTVIRVGGVPSPVLTWLADWRRLDLSLIARTQLTRLINRFTPHSKPVAPHTLIENFEPVEIKKSSSGKTSHQFQASNTPPQQRHQQSWIVATASNAIKRLQTVLRAHWNIPLEILFILIWALFVGRNYLDFSPNTLPAGGELPHLTQSHLIWRLLPVCGSCVLWNGQINGGAPSFVETSGAPLHPLVILTTLILGLFNGSKVIALAGLTIAGLGQWGLARTLKLGWVARMWSAFLAVAGGHLAAKMANGMLLGLLSTASVSLILPALVNLLWNGKRRSAVWLGIALALTALSGEGYIQIGTVIGVLPPVVLLLWDKKLKLKPIWRDLALALLLAFLLLGVFWAPLAHFFPNFIKDGDDTFSNFEPLAYIPFNLVVADKDFYGMSILGKDGLLYTHAIYIGWIPVLLALASLRFVPKSSRHLMWYFWISILLLFFVCSSEFARLIYPLIPGIKDLRHLSTVTGLAVPYLLGLAAWSIDRILKKVHNPRLGFLQPDGKYIGMPIVWLVLLPILIYSLKPVYDFGHQWLENWNIELDSNIIQSISTSSTAWVNPPEGEFQWIPILIERDLKLGKVWRPWFWKDNSLPPALFIATRNPDDFPEAFLTASFDNLRILKFPPNEYATVQISDESIPCTAHAMGGWIDVTCQAKTAGELIVYENAWSGWKVWRDGQPQELIDSQWLTVSAPAGRHVYSFRYQPWDVVLGLLFTLSGLCLAIWMLRRQLVH